MAKKKESIPPRQLSGRSLWEDEDEGRLLDQLKEAEAAFEDAMLRVSRFYSKKDEPMKAVAFMQRLSACTTDPEKKAFCLLSLGQLMEQSHEYESALECYFQAYLLEPSNSCSWYFIHNNIGCCLNHVGRYDEAEKYCREAIRIDPSRYNAHINLGVALEAQERYVEAARSFVEAMRANADDLELVEHLEELVEEHEEITDHISDIRDTLKDYRERARS